MNSYIKKSDNLDDMDKFLEIFNIPPLNEETENLNRSMMTKKFKR